MSKTIAWAEGTFVNVTEPFTVMLTNEAQQFATDSNRKVTSAQSYYTDIIVIRGSQERTDYTMGNITSGSGITVSKNSKRVTFSVSAGTTIGADAGVIEIPITLDGQTVKKQFSWSCGKQGPQGVKGENGSNFAWNLVKGTGTPKEFKPQANLDNSCVGFYKLDLSDNLPSLGDKFTISCDIEWTQFTQGTGGTFSWGFQGSTDGGWNYDNPFTIALQGVQPSKDTLLSSSGSKHLSASCTIGAALVGKKVFEIGARFNYSDGTGMIKVSNLKITKEDKESPWCLHPDELQGKDGKTSYFHVKYSNDGGKTFTGNSGEDTGIYMGSYTDYTEADSTDVKKYNWVKVSGDNFSWNLINNGKGNEKRGFFKNFSSVNATEEYGEITLTSKHGYIGIDLPGFVLNPRQYKVGKKVTWSYDIMYTKWDFPTGSNRQEYWMGQRYMGAPSGETATGQWVGVTSHNLPVVGQNGCELNKWFHVEVTKTIPTPASSNVGYQECINFYNSTDISATVTLRMKNVKLEYGDTATPWSPAQSDLEGRGISQTVQYYLATSQASGVTSSTSGWSTDITTQKLTADKKYLWNCYQTKYSDGTSEPISTPKVIGVYGDKGQNAKSLSITPSSQYFKSTDGGKTFAPNTITIKPTIQGEISFGKWQYSIDGGVSFADVVSGQTGLTINNNVLTVSKDSSLYSDDVTMVTFRAVANDSSFYDTCSIAKIYDVSDIGDGRNLWITRDNITLQACEKDKYIYTTTGVSTVCIGATGSSVGTNTIALQTGTKYTISFVISSPSEVGNAQWYFCTALNGTDVKNYGGYAVKLVADENIVSQTITVDTSCDAAGLVIYNLPTDCIIKDIQVEKGSSPTGWTPAPEDVQTAILSTKSEIADVSLKVDKNKQAIEQRVEKTTYQQDLNLVKGDISKANEGLNKWRYEIYPKSLFASEYQGKSTMDVFAKNTNLTPSQSVLINDTDFGKSWAYGDNYIGYALTFVKFSAAKSVAITFKHDDGAHLYLNGKLIGGDDTCNTSSGESLTLSFIQGWNCLEVVLNEKSGGEYIGLDTTISALSECQLMNCYYGTPVARQSHITNQLVENTTNIKGISTKVSKVTSVIGDNGENFTSFKNDYSDFKQTMNGFKTTVGQTYVTKDDFNGLEIGGRNLLLYSQTIRAHNNYYGVSYLIDEVETFNGCPVWSVKNQWGMLAWSFKSHVIDRELVKVGDTLTYSLYAKTNNASGKSISCSYRFKGNAQAYWFKGSAFNIGTSWARYSATFTVTKDMLATDTYMNEIGFEETASMSGDDKVYYTCPKLERGTKATDYTPAPEDVNGKIVNVETIANQTAKEFSWIVKGGDSSSNFTLTDRVADLVAERINFNGLVTFSGLNTDAKNEIGKVAQSKVDGLEVGGRNLVKKKQIQGIASAMLNLDNFLKNGTIEFNVKSTNDGFKFDSYDNYEPNSNYVLSYYFTKTNGTITKFGGFHNGKGNIFTRYTVDGIDYGSSGYSTESSTVGAIMNDGNRHRVVVCFTTPSSIKADDVVNFTYIQPGRGNNNPNFGVKIEELKLEKGNKATDWTPAPEDYLPQVDLVSNWTTNTTWIDGGKIYTGSIIADKIAANAITADKIATDAIKSHNYISSGGTQGSFLNLKDGSFTAPNLSWDLNGNLIAKNANLSGEITATKGSIGKYKITDQWLITGSGSTASGFGGNQAFWAGSSSSNDAPFRVGYDGKLYANGATISGDITATTGKIGDLTLKDGILTGTGSYSEPYTEDDDGTVTSTITTNYITKLFGKGLTIDSTVKYSDEDDVYSYKVSVLPDEISFTDGEEIGMLGAGGLQILQVNDNSDSYSSEANEVSLSSGASNFYYTTPVNQTTDKYLHVCFSADGASFMASQGDKFNSFDIGYSSAKYSGNFAANKFVYTGNSLNYVECLEANDTTNIYFHSNGYYSFRVNNEGNWSNETQSVYITERGISVPGQIGLYSQEMSNYVARYYIAGSTKSTAIGNNSYQTRIYGSSVWANKAVSTSDVRLKQDFQSLDKFEDLYMQLQPVSFKYIDGYDKSEDRYFGLKAQPTEKLFEDMGENPDDYAMFNKFGIDHEDIKERIGYDVDFDEEHGLDYTNLITLNTHMVQKTRRELAELQKENAELKDMLKTIVKKINM